MRLFETPPMPAPPTRRDRGLFPGEGELPLMAFLNTLPGDIPVGVEAPTGSTHPQMGAKERAVAACARELLASWH